MTDKLRTNYSTFDWWVEYEPDSEVVTVDKESIPDYQSDYVKCWNYIMSRGWIRDGKAWLSPDGKYRYSNVYEAYRCQRFNEDILNK